MKARVYLDPYSDFTFLYHIPENTFIAGTFESEHITLENVFSRPLTHEQCKYLMDAIEVAEIDLTEETTCKECGEGTQPGAGSARCPDCWNDRFGDYEEPGYD